MIKRHSVPRYIQWKNGPRSGRSRYVGTNGTVHWPAPRLPYTDTKKDERRSAIWAGEKHGLRIREHEADPSAGGIGAPTFRPLVALYEAEVGRGTLSWATRGCHRATQLLQEFLVDAPVTDLTPDLVLKMHARVAEAVATPNATAGPAWPTGTAGRPRPTSPKIRNHPIGEHSARRVLRRPLDARPAGLPRGQGVGSVHDSHQGMKSWQA
jgi:hypothetical protein